MTYVNSLNILNGTISVKSGRLDGGRNINSIRGKIRAGDVAGTEVENEACTGIKTPDEQDAGSSVGRSSLKGNLFAVQTRFSINNKTGDVFAEVVDNITGDVIMKVPAREEVELQVEFPLEIGGKLDIKV